MRTIMVRNVNHAFARMMTDVFKVDNGIRWERKDSRNGKVVRHREPVTTVYTCPRERVLINSVRDANPFFHVMEALWMLAGRNDVEWIAHFNLNMKKFSDDGVTFHGAYGKRWGRSTIGAWFGVDQIEQVIRELQMYPDSRRAVVAMWDPANDLHRQGGDFPCNTHIYFTITNDKLQMTVCNRSNDMIWGAYGANVVHMTFLQEYIAAHLDLGMGRYYQVSNDFHIYEDNPTYKQYAENYGSRKLMRMIDPYAGSTIEGRWDNIVPLIESTTFFDEELAWFMTDNWDIEYREPFFADVALPMRRAWEAHKDDRSLDAKRHAESISSDDWRKACMNWLERRL